ncbi:esterase-like activity of phytase family protein [Salegentibacter chungangensis]|uniref:Esterase-like activity of phytase family protein n=1 Tax=Salegentibacter chungangensis TaxID=1335724 RepID=A0ABW3NSD6_9FLAO
MKRIYYLLPLFSIVLSCATTRNLDTKNIELHFLDEYVIDAHMEFEGTPVGGLSGIDYSNGNYFMVSDQASNPRLYKAKIKLVNRSIDTVIIEDLIEIDRSSGFLKNATLDLESVRFDSSKDELILSSEGAIQDGKDPSVFRISENAEFRSSYEIPNYFTAKGDQKPRNNGVFEGLSRSSDHTGIWVAAELPLEKDGPKPKLFPTSSLTRITYFNDESKEASRQFAYKLDGISKLPINYFAVNGITEILEYQNDRFLVIERAYSAGYGSHGNTVKVFEVDASKATNTLNLKNLQDQKVKPAAKRLIFDFKSIENHLTDGIIDNIEGMCFGPVLPNGKQSFIFISDNNFNSYSKQLNQIFLFEIDIKN